MKITQAGGEGATYVGDKTIQGALTVTGQIKAASGVASAPGLDFANASGLYWDGGTISVAIANARQVAVGVNATLYLITDGGTLRFGSTADLILARDAANTLAQRNSTNAQEVRLYETYTDASNNSRLRLQATAGGDFKLFPEANGTGTLRGLQLGTSGGRLGFFGTTAIAREPIAAAATDAATTQTLANDLRTKLLNLGLVAA